MVKPKPVAHDGKVSWWDGTMTTKCGQKIPAGQHRAPGWLESYSKCPGCTTAGKKHNH